MKTTLRKKKLSGGRDSLFLDIYAPETSKGRYKEYLKLYIYSNPKDKRERDFNSNTMQLAQNICSRRQLELQAVANGFPIYNTRSINFIEYFSGLSDKKYNELGNRDNWDSTLKHIIKFAGENVPFSEVTMEWVEKFKTYLTKEARTKSYAPLSSNSSCSYFNRLIAALRQAVRDKIIPISPAEDVKGIKPEESQREFLTHDEIRKLYRTDCDHPTLKQAFLFSCLTGLRWSDIYKLEWHEVQYSDQQGWYIRFTQKKTKGVETLPISKQARELIGDGGDPEERVFKGLRYNSTTNEKLQRWIIKAGIIKHLTFHCARHTFATLQLTFGTDIYTVSKLLGHKHVSTTSIYTKVIDQKKFHAVNVIPEI